MPIIPVTKIPTPSAPTFPAYIIENSIELVFNSTTITEQRIPIFSLSASLSKFNSLDSLIDFLAPSDGIASGFRIFVNTNTTGQTFEIEFHVEDNEPIVILGIDGTADTLYVSASNINVNVTKGDKLHFEYIASSVPMSGELRQAYISLVFKPTSST